MNVNLIDNRLPVSFSFNLYRNQEKKFRKKAKKLKLMLPEYICTHGLQPYFMTGKAKYDFNYKTINLAILFIENYFTSRKTFNTKIHSYKLKHIVEEKIGSYVSNGELIIAMTTCGYNYKATCHYSPNCYFNISQMSLKQLINNK